MVLGDDFIEKPSVKSSLNSSHIEREIRSISVWKFKFKIILFTYFKLIFYKCLWRFSF